MAAKVSNSFGLAFSRLHHSQRLKKNMAESFRKNTSKFIGYISTIFILN